MLVGFFVGKFPPKQTPPSFVTARRNFQPSCCWEAPARRTPRSSGAPSPPAPRTAPGLASLRFASGRFGERSSPLSISQIQMEWWSGHPTFPPTVHLSCSRPFGRENPPTDPPSPPPLLERGVGDDALQKDLARSPALGALAGADLIQQRGALLRPSSRGLGLAGLLRWSHSQLSPLLEVQGAERKP